MQDNYPWRSTEALARKPGDRVQANQQGSSSLPRRKPSALSQRGVRLLTHDAMSHLLHIGRSLMPRRTPLALRRQARGPRLLLVEGRLAPLEQARRPRARLRPRGRLAPRALRARALALNSAGAGTRGPAPEPSLASPDRDHQLMSVEDASLPRCEASISRRVSALTHLLPTRRSSCCAAHPRGNEAQARGRACSWSNGDSRPANRADSRAGSVCGPRPSAPPASAALALSAPAPVPLALLYRVPDPAQGRMPPAPAAAPPPLPPRSLLGACAEDKGRDPGWDPGMGFTGSGAPSGPSFSASPAALRLAPRRRAKHTAPARSASSAAPHPTAMPARAGTCPGMHTGLPAHRAPGQRRRTAAAALYRGTLKGGRRCTKTGLACLPPPRCCPPTIVSRQALLKYTRDRAKP